MKKYKIGIIGIGRIAHVHIEALRKLENVQVVAISSRSNIVKKANKLGIEKYYINYKEMIDNENLDSVHITSSNDVHFEMASYALNHGVNVILEKPMTLNFDEAYKLYELSTQKPNISKIHFHNRFYAINQYIKNNIDKIGDIISIHGEYTQGWAASPDIYNWRDNKLYGGNTRVIADVGTHYFDLIEFLTGHLITQVSAVFKTVFDKRAGVVVDTEDIGAVIYKTNFGAIGSCLISQSIIGLDNKLTFTISGTKATFISLGMDTKNAIYADIMEGNKELSVTQLNTLKDGKLHDATTFVESFREAFRQFYHELGNHEFKSDYANFKDGLHSMKLIDAIYQSSITKKWVKV
ncbi:Gfo/Idh/MocA family protein [Acholeplasma granularum]|uniref:Gfo/Idh/MocA family protein n=1 Tax=Acholeplasma granularum TaxID=264635 RepID=UPI0004718E95|nr:Gfo/Idh/MocA family oxidoreductase [Acholeplasma granularum]